VTSCEAQLRASKGVGWQKTDFNDNNPNSKGNKSQLSFDFTHVVEPVEPKVIHEVAPDMPRGERSTRRFCRPPRPSRVFGAIASLPLGHLGGPRGSRGRLLLQAPCLRPRMGVARAVGYYGGMDQNPYEAPQSATSPPVVHGKTVGRPAGLPPFVFDGTCPVCRRVVDEVKAFQVMDKSFCLVIFWWFRRRTYVACPRCMRKIIWRRCAANIITGNVIWLLSSVPTTLAYDLHSRLGRKGSLSHLTLTLVVVFWMILVFIAFFGIIPALVRLSNP
jgi:hypothetical protein